MTVDAEELPHARVFTRLGVSQIHGVGVFAVAPIARDTVLFAMDTAELRWVDAAVLQDPDLTPAARRFYKDFAIRRDGQFGCPRSFDLLTPGWYLNEPAPGKDANVIARADCTMVASRDIASGEELTVRYATFSDT